LNWGPINAATYEKATGIQNISSSFQSNIVHLCVLNGTSIRSKITTIIIVVITAVAENLLCMRPGI
jgi:hypothetical protein